MGRFDELGLRLHSVSSQGTEQRNPIFKMADTETQDDCCSSSLNDPDDVENRLVDENVINFV